MGALAVLEPAVVPAVLALVVPRPSLGVPDDCALDGGEPLVPILVSVLDDASDEPSCLVVFWPVVDPDADALVDVEAGGGSGVFGGDSLPPHPAAPRRRRTTELIAMRFMKTSQ
jgi:hypothetical protein